MSEVELTQVVTDRIAAHGIVSAIKMLDGFAVVVEAKRSRRAFALDHEREAFKEQADAHRKAAARRRAVQEAIAAAISQAAARTSTSPNRALIHFASDTNAPSPCSALPNAASYTVVVTRPTSSSRHNRPLVQVLNSTEALTFRAHKAAALKRAVMGAKEVFASVRGLTHAATRPLAPAGRIAAASPHPAHGPDFSRMTANPFLRGMSLTSA